jgi:heptosyltransferase-2
MSWKRAAAETAVWMAARALAPDRQPVEPPRSLFVLRNNDLGDLLVITPLFEALRRLLPDARIVAGVGDWNVETLRGNPHVSQVMAVNAPWHNRATAAHGSPGAAMRYIARSPEIARLRRERFDVGIDVLGSVFGSLLMLRAGMPLRLGVKGYAGGHTAAHRFVDYNANEHVGRAALRFAELLGAKTLPDLRPQIFLTRAEVDAAEARWRSELSFAAKRRVIIAPGGGHPGRSWPTDHFVRLAEQLSLRRDLALAIIGGSSDCDAAEQIAAAAGRSFAGRLSLRESFALISRADLVFCNSSVAMHAAAAFDVPAVVLLGPDYECADTHLAQWGHGSLSLVLGRGRGRSGIYQPEDVLCDAGSHARVAAALFGTAENARA